MSIETAIPWTAVLTSLAVGMIAGVVIAFGGFVLLFGAFDAALPGTGSLRRLAVGLRDNVAAAGFGPVLAIGAFAGVSSLLGWAKRAFAAHAPADGYPIPSPLDGPLPLLSILQGAIVWGVGFTAIVLAFAAIRAKVGRDPGLFGAALVLIAPFLSSSGAVGSNEVTFSAVSILAVVFVGWFASAQLLGGNPFAYCLAGAAAKLVSAGFTLAMQSAPLARLQGCVALALGAILAFLPILVRRRSPVVTPADTSDRPSA